MPIFEETAVHVVNGVVTLATGGVALSIYLRKKPHSDTFLLWAAGFFLYGIEIFFYFPLKSLGFLAREEIVLLSDLFVVLAFLLFIAGAYMMINRFRRLFVISAPLVVVSYFLTLLMGQISITLALFLLTFYGSMIYATFILLRRTGTVAWPFFVGWTLLFGSNLMWVFSVPIPLLDGLATSSRVLIIFGMFSQRFTEPLLRVGGEHRSRETSQTNGKELETPSAVPLEKETDGLVRLVLCERESAAEKKEVDWLDNHLKQGTAEKRLTYIITAYDSPISKDVEKLAHTYGMHVVKLVPKPVNPAGHLSPTTTTIEIGDNPADFEEFLSLLLAMSVRSAFHSEIILAGVLSFLEKKWGSASVLSFLEAEARMLVDSKVVLACLLYPEGVSVQFINGLRRLARETIIL